MSRVRRVAGVGLLALLLAPAARPATLAVSPQSFSTAIGILTISGMPTRPAIAGVRLADDTGRPLGWIAAPELRTNVSIFWDGRLGRTKIAQGYYQVQLVVGNRVVASAPFRIDTTAPTLRDLRVRRGPRPYAGDGPLLTTISPNGDGLRDRALVDFTLSEPASVTLEVDRTTSVPVPIFSETAHLSAGPQTLAWAPSPNVPPRTYLLRLSATDDAGNRNAYGPEDAHVRRYPRAPVVRLLGVDAGFTRDSYAPGQLATLSIATDAPSLTLQVFRAGPEHVPTHSDQIMNGVPVSDPQRLGWMQHGDAPATIRFRMGEWPSGLYFLDLTAPDGRYGYAPFVVRPPHFGVNRVAVVLPTYTWQAYNFDDENGDGWGDTWYAGPPNQSVRLGRPFLHHGVPQFFRRYDLGFLHWLAWTGKSVDYLSESDLGHVATGSDLKSAYDLVVFPGHTEYVTGHEYDVIEQYRNAGGHLMFLSADNFFWRVDLVDGVLRRIAQWRDLARPEARLIGVEYRANDEGRHQGDFVVRSFATAPWLWAGTGLEDGSIFGETIGGYGIEIDSTTADSPPGTVVLADIPDLFGPGLTAQMTYYETPAGAKVFAAGALDFGGSTSDLPMSLMLENLWAKMAGP